jgi:hypothetical protein
MQFSLSKKQTAKEA